MTNPDTLAPSNEGAPAMGDTALLPDSFRKRFLVTSSPQLILIGALVRKHLDEVGQGNLPVLRRAVKSALKFNVAELSDKEIDVIQDALTAACVKILEKKTKEENPKRPKKEKSEKAMYSNEFSYSARRAGAGQYYGRVRKPLAE